MEKTSSGIWPPPLLIGSPCWASILHIYRGTCGLSPRPLQDSQTVTHWWFAPFHMQGLSSQSPSNSVPGDGHGGLGWVCQRKTMRVRFFWKEKEVQDSERPTLLTEAAPSLQITSWTGNQVQGNPGRHMLKMERSKDARSLGSDHWRRVFLNWECWDWTGTRTCLTENSWNVQTLTF